MKKKKVNSSNNLLYLIGIIAAIVLVVCFIMVFTDSSTSLEGEVVSLQLRGSETMELYVGEDYSEPGFIAEGSASGNLNEYVLVDGGVNENSEGTYDLSYTLSYNGAVLMKNRRVRVIKRPIVSQPIVTEETTNNEKNEVTGSASTNNNQTTSTIPSNGYSERIKIMLNGYESVYLLNGTTYNDAGAKAVTSSGIDVSNRIVKNGDVDVNTPGVYKISYTITDSSGSSATITRSVEVLNMVMYSAVSETSATNKSVVLKVNTTTDKFSHIILPDGKKISSENYEYVINKNGTYSFQVYNTYGLMREYKYTISNIDKNAPNGSCSGYTKGKNSYITIKASDNLGISKYVIDGVSYNSDSITLNQVISNPNIIIYDLVGNTKTISCTLENRYTYVSSAPSIKMSYQYINDGTTMPYALYTPSSVNDNQGTPLIVWLHGSGELGVGESTFKKAGLPAVLNNWKLDGVNAYVICPHLTGKYYSNWNTEKSLNNLNTLIEKLIKEKDIDTSKIVITGHSMGGRGAQYMAYYGTERYSAMVVLSGYYTGLDLSKLDSMPILGYVGTTSAGEDSASYSYMVGTFKKTFGSDKVIVINTSHGALPREAFTADSNKDNKSDLFEWMLAQEK